MITKLLSLAQESSPEKRHQLVEHVTRLFVTGADSCQTEEIAIFNSVLESMLATMEPAQKKAISEKLAPIDSTSHQVAYELGREEIDIARPMLTSSNALDAADILKLAKMMGQGHLLAISKRKHLEPRVTDVLLERGETTVKQSVAANPGAEFSSWGARMLIKLAESDDTIRDSMMERSDITEGDYDNLISLMPEQQQTRIRQLRDENEALIHDLFRKASKVVTSSKLERKATRICAKVTLMEIRTGQRSLGKAVTQLSLSNNLFDISFLLAEMAGVEQKYVTNVMLRYDATGVAILCRAMGIDDGEYTALCRARAAHSKQPQSTVEKWSDDYGSLSDKDARRLLSFTKIRLGTLEKELA
ncbi:DUF2336 domain-containing protein [Roseibium marinum]|uniref:Uncharacterized protein (DUF2336 family) n=1 Tax=Roseibium marinum TaxID=281252 RepID=A0A2S3UXD4_9HYPH|nr:DUF2336 domain-containing protein [Roseibium marinum]POF32346.1 uncharacterized protein (DUF2336 family) [Roseibium marinum]